jgi:hypothetical protein
MQIRVITWETTKNDKHLTRKILFNNISYPTIRQASKGLSSVLSQPNLFYKGGDVPE